MDWQTAKDLLLGSSFTLILGYASMLLKELVQSVQELNNKIAKILIHIENHELRIAALESRREHGKAGSHG